MTGLDAPWAGELEERLGCKVDSLRLLPGGASKEAWAVDAGGERLLVRRAGGGVIHRYTPSLERAFRVLQAAHEAGVEVPRPAAYLGLVGGREAVAVERVEGETIGRRIVRDPPPGLPEQMAEELAKIHAIPPERVPFLAELDPPAAAREELDLAEESHPAIEYGLCWLAERRPPPLAAVVSHGDFRIGKVAVSPCGLEYLLDWEFAHLGDPRDDLSWPLLRAWRFGADGRRLGGVGDPEPYRERYPALTQARRHLRGRSGAWSWPSSARLAAEVEYEFLDLIEKAAA